MSPSSADFAAARERLAARRRLRASDAARDLSTCRDSSLSRLPYPLNSLGTTGLAAWSSIRGREGTRPVFRVGQVDAELLDEELLELFKGQVGEALKYYGVGRTWSLPCNVLLCARNGLITTVDAFT